MVLLTNNKNMKNYEITLELRIPLVVNVEAKTAIQATELARNLVDGWPTYSTLEKASVKFESEYIDQCGDIKVKIISIKK